MSHQL